MDAYDKFLVLSFVGETRVLGLNDDDELDEADIQGFSSSSQARFFSPRVLHSCIVMLTTCWCSWRCTLT